MTRDFPASRKPYVGFRAVIGKLLRVTAVIIVTPVTAMLIGWGCLLWQNNRKVEPASSEEIGRALYRGIGWLRARREQILEDPNAVLWWMVERSAILCGDTKLAVLSSEYKRRHFDDSPNHPWQHLFDPDAAVRVTRRSLSDLPYYNAHWLSALTCDPRLASLEFVSRQNHPHFCSDRPEPACITHQLMGMRFMQSRGCGDPEVVASTIRSLQDEIVRLLTWDVRVVDVYVQRILMLVESGAGARLKPVWLSKVLDAQQRDGGFCWKRPSMGRPFSNFHTTAQAVMLLSLLSCDM
jgi:hypothetical protein